MQLDEMDLSMIRNMMLTKSPKVIAKTMSLPVILVQETVMAMYQELGMEYSWPQEKEKPVKVKKESRQEKKRREKEATERREAQEHARKVRLQTIDNRHRAGRPKEKVMKSRSIDYSQLVAVRVDAKTTIMVKPGEETKMLAKFRKTYTKPMDKFEK